MTVARLAILVLAGATLGGIAGSIITGDPTYFLVWPIALTLLFIVAGILGSTPRRTGPTAGRMPGIHNPGDPPPEPVQAVLNPEPTAIPATGATLNGDPVDIVAPKAPRSRGSGMPRGLSRAIGIAIILAVAALTLIPSYRLIGWTATGIAQGRWDAADPRTGLHQQEMVDDLAAAAGGYDFVSIAFYDGYVLAQAPTTPTARTTDNFEWRYGRATRLGPANGVIEGLFDASRIDFSVVAESARRAMADAGWGQFSYVYPAVRMGPEGEPVISVSIGSDYYSAGYTFSVEGELIDSYGTGLD